MSKKVIILLSVGGGAVLFFFYYSAAVIGKKAGHAIFKDFKTIDRDFRQQKDTSGYQQKTDSLTHIIDSITKAA